MQQTRFIMLDTETTGLSWAKNADRIIEIGCVEYIGGNCTEKEYHCFLNPEKPVDPESFQVHGLSDEFLSDKPKFADEVDGFLDFIGSDGVLVIHNAKFDMGFLNYELSLLNKPKIPNYVIDTLDIARKKYPGKKASLDALCDKFDISLETREKHGAIIDSRLLGEVFKKLIFGEDGYGHMSLDEFMNNDGGFKLTDIIRRQFPQRDFPLTDEEIKKHAEVISSNIKNNLWGL